MLPNPVALVCHLNQPPTSASTQSVIHSGRASLHANKSQCLACQDLLGARCAAQVSLPRVGLQSPPTGQPALDLGHPYPLYMLGVVIYPAWDLGAVYFQCLWSKSTLQQFAVDFQCLCSKGTLLDSVSQPEPPFKLILKV